MIDLRMWRLFTEAKRTRRVSKIVRRRGGAGGLSKSRAEEEEEEAGERLRGRGGYDTGVASGRKRRVKVSCNYPEASYV